MKKTLSYFLALCCTCSTLILPACNSEQTAGKSKEGVLRIASWDEYIDMGGEDSYYDENSRPLYEEFEDWYFETYQKHISVEYVALQDNETMYNKIKMGDYYDLLCPSEYMIMKLATEDYIQTLPQSLFDESNPNNYYVKNLSPFIKQTFENGKMRNGKSWSEYAAGYMWGSTGFVFNPEKIGNSVEESRKIMGSWNALANPACTRKITAKDNARDSYFMGLGMYFEKELLALKEQYNSGLVSRENYRKILEEDTMNNVKDETILGVKKCLESMRKNLYGLETDEGKLDVIMGRLDASFQWSGDAVYILDQAEEISNLKLEYRVPEAASNLWFDGWVLMKDSKNVDAATAFINFLSMQENVVRNMYYIGYTSCIAGDEVFSYLQDQYGDEEGDTSYDLSYFFGENYLLQTNEESTRRQLFAQYPDKTTIDRLVVMKEFDKSTNEKVNRMWNNIK